MDPLLDLVALCELPGMGPRRLWRMIGRATPPQAAPAWPDVVGMAADGAASGLPARARAAFVEPAEHLERCRRMLERLRACGIHPVSHRCPSYPAGWHRFLDLPPPLVYCAGNPRLLREPKVAILASRGITERSVGALVTIAQSAARLSMTVVSGGMKSTHRIVTVTARACGARRIVVLDRGILTALGRHPGLDPFGFGPARAPLDAHSTLVLSPFRASDHAAPANGRRRDQLIAALADVVVAASARPGGEIERICLEALDRGHCVFTWQGESPALLAAGATAVDAATLENHLRWSAAAGSVNSDGGES